MSYTLGSDGGASWTWSGTRITNSYTSGPYTVDEYVAEQIASLKYKLRTEQSLRARDQANNEVQKLELLAEIARLREELETLAAALVATLAC